MLGKSIHWASVTVTEGKGLALHTADWDSIPSTPQGPMSQEELLKTKPA